MIAFSADVSRAIQLGPSGSDANQHSNQECFPYSSKKISAQSQVTETEGDQTATIILKAIYPMLQDALNKESDLKGDMVGSGQVALTKLMDGCVQSTIGNNLGFEEEADHHGVNGDGFGLAGEVTTTANLINGNVDNPHDKEASQQGKEQHASQGDGPEMSRRPSSGEASSLDEVREAQSALREQHAVVAATMRDIDAESDNGGVPWYLESFQLSGTMFHGEHRFDGQVVSNTSEEVSEMEEAELQGLGNEAHGMDEKGEGAEGIEVKKPPAKKRKKGNRSR